MGTTTSERSWLTEVLEADPHYYEEKRKEIAYEFSNGREFLCSDASDSGVYDGG